MALSEVNHKQKWWKPFTKPFLIHEQQHPTNNNNNNNLNNNNNNGLYKNATNIFGTPLQDSLQLASVAISMLGPDKKPYIYGFIPVIVAKCGLYLKEHATQTEGIFRISGSTKRIQQLQSIFSQPPFYGKDLEWSTNHHQQQQKLSNSSSSSSSSPILNPTDQDQPIKPYFSVHDAANLLRRYLMCLPEPLINQSMYQDLRQVLTKHSGDKARQIRLFKSLISTLDPSTQYLLLYLLDLLAVFANRSDKNLMTANNLAVVFQPALCPANPTTQAKLNRIIYAQPPTQTTATLPPPHKKTNHDDSNPPLASIQQASLREQESIMKHVKQAQAVVEFLIQNQNHFVVGLRPQPTLARENQVTDRWINRRPIEGQLVSTPRPTSCQSALQTPPPSKQQQQQQENQQQQQQEGEVNDDRREQPATHLRPRRLSNLRRSQTVPVHHPSLEWKTLLNQSVGAPINTNHQQNHHSPPQYLTPLTPL